MINLRENQEVKTVGSKIIAKSMSNEVFNKTESGIFIPTESTNEEQQLRVVQVGPDVKNVKPDDIIIVSDYSMKKEVKINNETCYILLESEVILIVTSKS